MPEEHMLTSSFSIEADSYVKLFVKLLDWTKFQLHYIEARVKSSIQQGNFRFAYAALELTMYLRKRTLTRSNRRWWKVWNSLSRLCLRKHALYFVCVQKHAMRVLCKEILVFWRYLRCRLLGGIWTKSRSLKNTGTRFLLCSSWLKEYIKSRRDNMQDSESFIKIEQNFQQNL